MKVKREKNDIKGQANKNDKKIREKIVISNKTRKIIFIVSITIVAIISIILIIVSVKNNNKNVNMLPPTEGQNTKSTENVKVSKDGIKTNNSKEFLKEKEFNGLIISNINFTSLKGLCTFTAKVDNKTGKKFEGTPVQIILKNNKNEQIDVLEAYIGQMEPDESTNIDASITSDMSNAYNFEINIE